MPSKPLSPTPVARLSSQSALAARNPLSTFDVCELAALFKMLGNETRVRLLYALLQAGELCVGDLAKEVGMKPQAVSNQLQRLADRGIVATRREGINIHYRVTDPCVAELMERGRCLLADTKPSTQSMKRRAAALAGPLTDHTS